MPAGRTPHEALTRTRAAAGSNHRACGPDHRIVIISELGRFAAPSGSCSGQLRRPEPGGQQNRRPVAGRRHARTARVPSRPPAAHATAGAGRGGVGDRRVLRRERSGRHRGPRSTSRSIPRTLWPVHAGCERQPQRAGRARRERPVPGARSSPGPPQRPPSARRLPGSLGRGRTPPRDQPASRTPGRWPTPARRGRNGGFDPGRRGAAGSGYSVPPYLHPGSPSRRWPEALLRPRPEGCGLPGGIRVAGSARLESPLLSEIGGRLWNRFCCWPMTRERTRASRRSCASATRLTTRSSRPDPSSRHLRSSAGSALPGAGSAWCLPATGCLAGPGLSCWRGRVKMADTRRGRGVLRRRRHRRAGRRPAATGCAARPRSVWPLRRMPMFLDPACPGLRGRRRPARVVEARRRGCR